MPCSLTCSLPCASTVHLCILVHEGGCSAVNFGVQCSFLPLFAMCNACKLSRQSVGLIEPCRVQECIAQNNSTVARIVLCSCRRVQAEKKMMSPHATKWCIFFAQLLQFACACTFQTGALRIQLAACVAHVPILKTCNSHLSHKWYKMTRGPTRSYQAWKKANMAMRVPKVAPFIIISIILLSLFYFYVLGNFN